MNTALKIGFAGVVIVASAGIPCLLHRQARLELRARQDAFEQQASRLSLLAEENGRLSNLVAQANASPSLTEDQLRELLRLRNEKRWLAEQTNLLVRLAEQQAEPEDEGIGLAWRRSGHRWELQPKTPADSLTGSSSSNRSWGRSLRRCKRA